MNTTLETFNYHSLIHRCMGELDFAKSIIDQFIEEWDGNVRKISEHLTEERLDDVASAAHRIKGTASMIGADQLSEILATIEKFAESNSVSEVRKCLDLSQSEMAQLRLKVSENF